MLTEVKGLAVVWCECNIDARSVSDKYSDDGDFGWRVEMTAHDRVLPVKYACERDAIVGMHSIANLIDWTGPIENVGKLKWQFGIKTLRFSQCGRDILKFTHEGIEFTGVFSEAKRQELTEEFLTECIDGHLQEAGY